MSQFAIISDPNRRFKFSILSKAVVSDVALINPEVTQTMDIFLTACTGVDAMVHAIEAYVSTGSGPLTDSHTLGAINLINANLEALIIQPTDAHLREQLFCSVHDFDYVRLSLFSDGQVRARELSLLRRNGEVVEVALTLLRRPDLGPEVVEAFVADITERQQARKRLEESNAELETRVQAQRSAIQPVIKVSPEIATLN